MFQVIEFAAQVGYTFASCQAVLDCFAADFEGFYDNLCKIEDADTGSKDAVLNSLQLIQKTCSDMVLDLKKQLNTFLEVVRKDQYTSTPPRGNIFKLKIEDNHPRLLETYSWAKDQEDQFRQCFKTAKSAVKALEYGEKYIRDNTEYKNYSVNSREVMADLKALNKTMKLKF